MMVGYVRALQPKDLAAQESQLRAYADRGGHELLAVYHDAGVTAEAPLHHRPGGRQVVQALLRGDARRVGAVTLGSLFGTAGEALQAVDEWSQLGVTLTLLDLNGQVVDSADFLGRLLFGMLQQAVTMDRQVESERARLVARRQREAREYHGGPPPYGWRVGADGVQLEPVAEEQQAIALARQLHTEGSSHRAIAVELTAHDLPPRTGLTWWPSQIARLLVAELEPEF